MEKISKEKIHPDVLAMQESFECPVSKKVAAMIATSHEYKKPNTKAGLHFTKNYKWSEGSMRVSDMQGINKPIIDEKVESLAKAIGKSGRISPFVVVNQLDAIRPQTPGKKILIDGHHRLEACKKLGIDEVPVYRGDYTGDAHKDIEELKKAASSAVMRSFVYGNPYTGMAKIAASDIDEAKRLTHGREFTIDPVVASELTGLGLIGTSFALKKKLPSKSRLIRNAGIGVGGAGAIVGTERSMKNKK